MTQKNVQTFHISESQLKLESQLKYVHLDRERTESYLKNDKTSQAPTSSISLNSQPYSDFYLPHILPIESSDKCSSSDYRISEFTPTVLNDSSKTLSGLNNLEDATPTKKNDQLLQNSQLSLMATFNSVKKDTFKFTESYGSNTNAVDTLVQSYSFNSIQDNLQRSSDTYYTCENQQNSYTNKMNEKVVFILNTNQNLNIKNEIAIPVQSENVDIREKIKFETTKVYFNDTDMIENNKATENINLNIFTTPVMNTKKFSNFNKFLSKETELPLPEIKSSNSITEYECRKNVQIQNISGTTILNEKPSNKNFEFSLFTELKSEKQNEDQWLYYRKQIIDTTNQNTENNFQNVISLPLTPADITEYLKLPASCLLSNFSCEYEKAYVKKDLKPGLNKKYYSSKIVSHLKEHFDQVIPSNQSLQDFFQASNKSFRQIQSDVHKQVKDILLLLEEEEN